MLINAIFFVLITRFEMRQQIASLSAERRESLILYFPWIVKDSNIVPFILVFFLFHPGTGIYASCMHAIYVNGQSTPPAATDTH